MTKQSEPTPVMQQFHEAKVAAGDAILLFRMGDFYELFYDDAFKASEILGLTVTSRDRNRGPDATPMAGFPYHQLDLYLARLIIAGCKVAVCEQMEDPKKTKKIVKRSVVRIVTPGTVTDDAVLDPKSNNYLSSVVIGSKPRFAVGPNDLALVDISGELSSSPTELGERATTRTTTRATSRGTPSYTTAIHPDEPVGLAWVELSTGEFSATVLPFRDLEDQLARIHSAEILVSEAQNAYFPSRAGDSAMRTLRPDWTFNIKTAGESLRRQFKVQTLEGFGFSESSDMLAIAAAGAVLDYLRETQKQSLDHLDTLARWRPGGQLEIDAAGQRSLELFRTGFEGRREGSLLSVIDRCVTPMGSRLLAEWLTWPLTNLDEISARLDAVEELLAVGNRREELRKRLRNIHDLARILSRVLAQRVSPRELVAIGKTLAELPAFVTFLTGCHSPLLKTLGENIFPLPELAAELAAALVDEPPLNPREGGFIQNGYHAELDEMRALQHGGKEWLATYQSQESQRLGIPTLKVGFNSVFGYYIEVTQIHTAKIPASYVRKQTLKNAERYITDELKVYEEKVLGAEEKAKQYEFELFERLRQQVAEERGKIQRSARVLCHLDVLANLAQLAADRSYVRPKLVSEPILHIREGRHPVLEVTETAGSFVPNDADCSPEGAMIHLITGPNMAGKSTFIRQVALLTILAQIGSYIPAAEATIGIADKIYARVGASDELTRGLSTFMVEMIETARILHGATPRSLVVLDEIGRGTSTYDGISLAWAIAESLHERTGCRTFFATHYHELTDLAETCGGIDNLNVAVREWDDEIAFLHKIVPGAADRSYGIHVARLAGVPSEVILRAKKILTELEAAHLAARHAVGGALKRIAATPFFDDGDSTRLPGDGETETRGKRRQTTTGGISFSLFGPDDHPVVEELRTLALDSLTPLDALTLLNRWKATVTAGDKKRHP